MENLVFNNFMDGFKLLLSYLNTVFIIVLISSIWIFTKLAESGNHAQYLNWARKLPKFLWALIFNIFWVLAFVYFFRMGERIEIFQLLISSIAAAFIYGMGIKNILAWLVKKFTHQQ
jgi:hypothetical protein